MTVIQDPLDRSLLRRPFMIAIVSTPAISRIPGIRNVRRLPPACPANRRRLPDLRARLVRGIPVRVSV